MRLRASPANREYKEKVRAERKLIPFRLVNTNERFSLLYPPSIIIPHLSHFILVSLVTSDYNSYPTAYEDEEQA